MKTIPTDRTIDPGWNARRGCKPNKVAKARFNRFSGLAKQTILVPMDFSDVSLQALDHALCLAELLEASVVLLHVVERIYAEGFLDTPAKSTLRTEVHDEARKRLDAIVESKSNCFAPIKRIVCGGMPQHEILRIAESMGVDLIVLGLRPRNLLGRWLLGSVSNEIIDTAPCPVLVVKPSRFDSQRGRKSKTGES